MEIGLLIKQLEDKFPIDLQENWDNSGLQIGNKKDELKNIMICLDLEDEAVDKAIEKGCNLIITHHPYLFNPIKTIDFEDSFNERLKKVIKNDITVYSMHTNLDKAKDGVNDNLCKVLGFTNKTVLDDESNFGLISEIEEISAEKLSQLIKQKLKAKCIITYGDLKKKIKRVSYVGGSGSDFFDVALKKGVDYFLTSDVKYHQGMDYSNRGLFIADCGHYISENHIIYHLKDIVEKMCQSKVYTYSKGEDFRDFI